MGKDDDARDAIEERKTVPSMDTVNPAAGPHAKPELTDKTKTPGAGSLPDDREGNVDPGSS